MMENRPKIEQPNDQYCEKIKILGISEKYYLIDVPREDLFELELFVLFVLLRTVIDLFRTSCISKWTLTPFLG